MNNANLVRLPLRFFVDRSERDLPMPDVVRSTRQHVFVRRDDPAMPDLLDDAQYYAADVGFDAEYRGLIASAKATVIAIEQAARHD